MEQERKEFNGFRFIWQLLGTLVLLGVISAVLFPILAQPPRRSVSYVCLSHTKQLTTGTIIYCADNDDAFPPYYSLDSQAQQNKFYDATMPYVKNRDTFLCSKDESNRKNTESKASQ
jgi:hypothetical protein